MLGTQLKKFIVIINVFSNNQDLTLMPESKVMNPILISDLHYEVYKIQGILFEIGVFDIFDYAFIVKKNGEVYSPELDDDLIKMINDKLIKVLPPKYIEITEYGLDFKESTSGIRDFLIRGTKNE